MGYNCPMLGLVLGGGAAKGYAHIGVLKLLAEVKIKPAIIVGASMGALVGGLYAAGYSPDELITIAAQVDRKKKRWLFPLHFSKKGLVDGKHIMQHLVQFTGDTRIEELDVKFATVATDIERCQEIIIDRGSLLDAIRAAISIPVVFMPYHYQGRLLIDGGFVNPLPIDICRRLGASTVIAVNVLRKIDYVQQELSAVAPSNASMNVKRVFLEYIDCATARLIDYQLMYLKGILMNINTDDVRLGDFEKGMEAIQRGYADASNYRAQLKRFKT
jgi:predicted acylesterase/phospholipase RssA